MSATFDTASRSRLTGPIRLVLACLCCAGLLTIAAVAAGQEYRPGLEADAISGEPALHTGSGLSAQSVANAQQTTPNIPLTAGEGRQGLQAAAAANRNEAAEPQAPRASEATQPEAEPPAKQAATIRLFGTVEFRSPIKNLPKWERVRNAEIESPSFTPEGIDAANKSVVQRWKALKEKFKDSPLPEKVREVNKFFNQWPYKTDLEVWGVEDYWATPKEFVQKSGDCEDYAISKYYALRDLGVPASLLRVAAVKDTIRNIGHAVTIVYMNEDAHVLDNLTNLVLSHNKLKHYAPQYTVNEEYLWRHVKPKSAPGKK